jgi:ankyrin repeat protein
MVYESSHLISHLCLIRELIRKVPHVLITIDDVALADALLRAGSDINYTNQYGDCAFSLAASSGWCVSHQLRRGGSSPF